MERFLALHEFEPEARQWLPRAVYEYVAGGAAQEYSIRAIEESYQENFLRPASCGGRAGRTGARTVWKAFSCTCLLAPGRLPAGVAACGLTTSHLRYTQKTRITCPAGARRIRVGRIFRWTPTIFVA